ncbi:MAG: hypothetical protein HFF29_06385 [Oscillospiraceae bacterium]|nr:hypothetical protein [Oscillospiraceae bacterium]
MKQNAPSLARVFPVLLLCLLCLVPTAYADIGPKPEVTITVVNAPEGVLYLDLLAQGEPTDQPYSNSNGECDPALLDNLRSLEGDGWVLAYTTGTKGPPVFGDVRPREDGTWRFSYVGLPESFRVAAATADEAKAAEVSYTRDFVDNIVYDWQANTVREATPPPLRFLVRLAATLIPTLLIEGALFWLFGFRERRGWLVFLAVNTATQVGLHLAVGSILPQAGWHFLNYTLTILIPELIIWAAEAAAYAFLLREHSRGRRVGYAFAANFASFVLGYFPLHLLYDLLRSL